MTPEQRRKYQNLSGRELEAELATQLKTPVEGGAIEVTAFGDANRSWLLPDRLYGASHTVTSNAATIDSDDVVYSTNTFDMGSGRKYTLEQAYLHGKDGTIKAVGPTKVREREESKGRETNIEWLRRRVDEILWVPA